MAFGFLAPGLGQWPGISKVTTEARRGWGVQRPAAGQDTGKEQQGLPMREVTHRAYGLPALVSSTSIPSPTEDPGQLLSPG